MIFLLQLKSNLWFREGVISCEFGVRALSLAAKNCLSLEEAFEKLGWHVPQREMVRGNELGQLLFESGVINLETIKEGLMRSEENDLPLGRCLVLMRAISPTLLSAALTAQVLLRDGKITHERSIIALKQAAIKHQTIEQSLHESGAIGHNSQSIRVGELLSLAGLIRDGERISAIEVGLSNQKPIGQVLVESGVISGVQLQECLRLQELVTAGQLTCRQAAEILRAANMRGVPIEVVITERNAKEDEIARANSVIELIFTSGILTELELEKDEKTSVTVGCFHW